MFSGLSYLLVDHIITCFLCDCYILLYLALDLSSGTVEWLFFFCLYAYHNLESHQKNKSSWRAIIGKTPVFSYLRNSSDSHLFTFFWFLWHLLLNTLFSLFVWSLACPLTSNKMFDCKVWSLLPGMVQKQIKNEFSTLFLIVYICF